MHTTTRHPPPTVSVHNVLSLTAIWLLGMAAAGATVLLGAGAAGIEFPRLGELDTTRPWLLAAIVLAQLSYLASAHQLAGRQCPRARTVRYALLLQLQAAIELLVCIVTALLVCVLFYGFLGMIGDHGLQQTIQQAVADGRAVRTVYLLALAIPMAAILCASARLHMLSSRAVAALIEDTLTCRQVMVPGEADSCELDLRRHLERLTRVDAPALGRIMYGRHPRLVTRTIDNAVVHELTWWTCPMALHISLQRLDEGRLELRVRCVLRGGIYRMYLIPTPLDVLAQMAYIDGNLIQPFLAQRERLNAQHQQDALRNTALEAQLRVLQAQIEPHFLFNTLANVRQSYRDSHADGETMLDHLIAYLRSAMEELRADRSSVVQEMDTAMHFLAIMQARMGTRLAYRCVAPEALLAHPVPPAMLISLVENAIKHGLADSDDGEIILTAARDGDLLRLSVSDNGAGFSSVGGSGAGLTNIRQRLEAIYGSRAWLEVGSPAEGGFCATIIIPFEQGARHADRPAG